MRDSAQGRVGSALALVAMAATALLGCKPQSPPEEHFYDVHIQPIFNTFCVGNTSPCHSLALDTTTSTSTTKQYTALGNLDLSSFEGVQKRRDVLRTYGSYPQPLLLLKAMPPDSIQIPYAQKFYPSEIQHSGGSPISPNTEAYFELKTWLDNGANRDGIAPVPTANQGIGHCSDALPPVSQRVPITTSDPAYQRFLTDVEPMLESSCAYGTCHSSVQADLYLTCGSSGSDAADELAFNYAQVAGFVVQSGVNVDQSEILLRPLAVATGGVSHTGGTFFQSRSDSNWLKWEAWAKLVQAAPPLPYGPKTAGQTFFEENVMPKLLVRGCDLEGCHSPDGFNDFRLRSGAFGFFAPAALTRNYHALADEFMAFDTVDLKQSRAVKKNILVDSGGTTHRAGSILEDFGHSVDDPCPQPFDPATNTRAFCVVQAWQQQERMDRIAAGAISPMNAGDVLPLAFISRPPNADTLLEFDTYEGGADLKLADATIDATGTVTSVGNIRSALGSCAGLTGDVDVRGPEWSYDGTKLVFAARPGAGSGLDLWMLDVKAGTCTQLTTDAGKMVNGIRIHNFDPAFAPDNTIVFASTRAGTQALHTMLPASNLYRVKPSAPATFTYGDFSNPEQMTFLLNSQLSPAFMQDGRVSLTAEKATPTFYQLSGRRMNWDLTDYHPLLAQRAQSTSTFDNNLLPSVGYQQATEIREGLDRNFLLILSNEGSRGGGGALATFNRSIGPFEADRTDITFVRSMVIVDPAAAPMPDGTTTGAYRSPFSLPNGEILVSYAGAVTNLTTDTPQYDLVAINPNTGVSRSLAKGGASSYVEAALGYKRGETEQFVNLPQLVFGGHIGQPNSGQQGVMHFPDLPVLATLLGANLRRGRDVSLYDSAASLKVYIDHAPPPNSTLSAIPSGMLAYQNLESKGSVSLASDHSVQALVPAGVPLILEVDDGNGKPLFTMTEEHQVQPSEYITPGPPRAVFNNICGGCHGSLSGSELDIAVNADALTGATVSISAPTNGASPQQLH